MFAVVVGLLAFQSAPASADVGPFVRSFWLLQAMEPWMQRISPTTTA